MNERILELANNAGRYRSHNGGINGGPNPALLYGDESIQKFAELLIRECAELTCWHDYEMSAEQRVRLEVCQDIKKHFGVEWCLRM